MRKPDKTPVKDWLIRNVALEVEMKEDVVKDIVDHQSASAREAMFYNNSVELSGFGKFYFKVKKAKARLEKCYMNKKYHERMINDENSTEKKKRSHEYKLKVLLENIDIIESKLKNVENK